MVITYGIIFLLTILIAYYLLRASNKHKIPVLLVVITISMSVLIYFYIGNPDYSDQPYRALKTKETSLNKLSLDELINLYEKGLQKKDSPNIRLVLGNMLVRLNRLEQAKIHFKAAYDMDKGKTADIIIAYAEILITLNQGLITPDIKKLIDETFKKDSKNPKGLFYEGLFLAQNNDIKQATDIWKNLIKQSKDKPYYKNLVENLNAVRQKFNIKPFKEE